MASYSSRHLDPQEALRYRGKFERSPIRRLSSWREKRLVQKAMRAALQELAPAIPTPTLLDIPCGAGRFAPLLASFGVRYLGADHSPHMIHLCHQSLSEAGHPSLGFFRSDARALGLRSKAVDLCCCLRLLHHFPQREDRAKILAQLRRVCRGPVILSFLDGGSPKQWFHRTRLALGGRQSRRTLLEVQELREEAADAGFQLAKTWSLSGLFSGQSIALLLPDS
ncbi:MAG TPA: class I SAM-dependent methyltransferase [Planctomycetes bacterium]|nr:class I SAM-dependent methyltransferase [Planctomycetota bacterium]